MTTEEMKQMIRAKVVELAAEIGRDARNLTDDQAIPTTGYLDSAAIMGLIAWYETAFDLDIPQEDITLDNFGSVNQMVDYAQKANRNA